MPNCSDISTRSYNLDALRVLSMFFIVLGHFWHGGRPTSNYGKFVEAFYTSFSVIGVNLFFLLSGYFQGRKQTIRTGKVVSIWGGILFYSLAIMGILWAFAGIKPGTGLVIRSFFPLLTVRYWFMTVYVFLYLISPYVNRVLNSCSKNDFLHLLAILFFVFSIVPTFLPKDMAFNPLFNTSCIWGLVMYCVGIFLMRFGDEILISGKTCFGIYMLITIVIFLTDWQLPAAFEHFGINSAIPAKLSRHYYSPLLLCDAVACFGFFRHINIKTKCFSLLAPYMLGIYLIHDNNQIRDLLWKNWLQTPVYLDSHWLPVYVLCCSISVFVVCLGIEAIRSNVTNIVKHKSILLWKKV